MSKAILATILAVAALSAATEFLYTLGPNGGLGACCQIPVKMKTDPIFCHGPYPNGAEGVHIPAGVSQCAAMCNGLLRLLGFDRAKRLAQRDMRGCWL